jgi:hypothetical protein
MHSMVQEICRKIRGIPYSAHRPEESAEEKLAAKGAAEKKQKSRTGEEEKKEKKEAKKEEIREEAAQRPEEAAKEKVAAKEAAAQDEGVKLLNDARENSVHKSLPPELQAVLEDAEEEHLRNILRNFRDEPSLRNILDDRRPEPQQTESEAERVWAEEQKISFAERKKNRTPRVARGSSSSVHPQDEEEEDFFDRWMDNQKRMAMQSDKDSEEEVMFVPHVGGPRDGVEVHPGAHPPEDLEAPTQEAIIPQAAPEASPQERTELPPQETSEVPAQKQKKSRTKGAKKTEKTKRH